MRISLIVAMSRNRVIGRDGGLPWRLSSDLKRFKQLTMGHHLLMGRKTFESIGRVLPGRQTIVITRQTDYRPDGVEVAAGLEQAIELARGDSELFITGGGEIYRIALPLVQRIYLTWVDADVQGDTLFPEWNEAEWQLVLDEPHAADEKNDYPHHFRVYDRCAP